MELTRAECRLLIGCIMNVIEQDESGGSEEQLAEAKALRELEAKLMTYMNHEAHG